MHTNALSPLYTVEGSKLDHTPFRWLVLSERKLEREREQGGERNR